MSPLAFVVPTATHSHWVKQETPEASVWAAPGASAGVEASAHVVPFHTAAIGVKAPTDAAVCPTALQVVGLKQFTAIRLSFSVVETFGLETTDQADPFQDSTSVCPGFTPSEKVPTAWQKDAPTHETPARLLLAPLTSDPLGLETMAQDEPFHCSTRVDVELPDPRVLPVATQNPGPLHDTALSSLSVDPVGAGTVTADHVVPFHCSTNGTGPDMAVAEPTATQLVLDVQVTPFSAAGVAGALGCGVACDQVEPFHCSITTPSVPLFAAPTVAQNVVPTQDTPRRSTAPLRVGLATTAHVAPFHCSMSPLVPPVICPVATQKVELVHDTASRRFWVPVPDDGIVPWVNVVALTCGGTVMVPAADAAGASPTRTPPRALARNTVKTAVRRMQAPP
jgi:hypothetical protein